MFRAIVLLCVAGLIVLGAIEYGPTVMQRLGMSPTAGGDPAPGGSQLGGSGSPATDLGSAPDDEPDDVAPRQAYRYLDASGNLHFVDALEKVPEAYRATAKPMGGKDLPQLTRATDKRPRRPSTYQRSMDGRVPVRRPENVSSIGSAPARQARVSANVVLYSTSWCGWCRKTMAWLDERGIDYENRDIERNDTWREELIEKTGKSSIPMVEIDGEVIEGFNPDRMSELL